MLPKISVVIGTFNQKETLKMVLESLFRQQLSPEDYEIVLVDSSSTDGTEEMVKNLNPNCFLNYIRQENRGRSAARNRGIKEARAEIILFTDGDMIADEKLLAEHLIAHKNYENVAIEGLTYNLKKLEDYKNPENLTPYIHEKLKSGDRIRWSYFLTGNLSIRKKTILDVGMFDEDFIGYGWEDVELGYRLYKKGVPLIYLPSAVNYHYHLVSPEDMLKRKYQMGKSAMIFYAKHKNLAIKYFLGMNPLAMGVYAFIKKRKNLLSFIEQRAKTSPIFRYILEEYHYRRGIEDVVSKEKTGKMLLS